MAAPCSGTSVAPAGNLAAELGDLIHGNTDTESEPNDDPDDDALLDANKIFVKEDDKKRVLEQKKRRDLKLEAKTIRHKLTHKYFNKYCDDCQRAKAKQRQRGRKSLARVKRHVREFGDVITADHVDMSTLHNEGLTGATDALVILDVATRFLGVAAVDSKDAEATEIAIRTFLDGDNARLAYSDNAGNLKKAMADQRIVHEFSLPGVQKSNGLIERYVQDVLQGVRTLLVQAGLPLCFWPYAADCFVFCSNVFGHSTVDIEENEDDDGVIVADPVVPAMDTDEVKNPGGDHSFIMGKKKDEVKVIDFDSSLTPWQRRYGVGNELRAKAIPFGAGVFYLPAPTKTSLAKVGTRLQYGVFLGYVVEPGGRWNHKYHVAALDDFVGKDLHQHAKRSQFPHFSTHITSVVRMPTTMGLTFPLKSRYDFSNCTLEGLEDTNGLELEDIEVPNEIMHGPAEDDVIDEEDQVAEAAGLGDGYSYKPRSDGRMRLHGPDGYEYRKNSTRPLGVHPDLWRALSKSQQDELKRTWDGNESYAEMMKQVKSMVKSRKFKKDLSDKGAELLVPTMIVDDDEFRSYTPHNRPDQGVGGHGEDFRSYSPCSCPDQ